MNKLTKLVVVSCALAGFAIAAQAQYAGSAEFVEMEKWLFSSYTNGLNEKDNNTQYYIQKEAYYAFIDGIREKIKQELPVDPQLQKQVDAIKAAGSEAEAKKLQEFGVTTGWELFESLRSKYGDDKGAIYESEEYRSYSSIGEQTNVSVNNAMKAYNDEIQSRFEAAFIQAVKKYQENAVVR